MNKKCRVISITLNKGGVGKSTTCINLGTALANRGHKVLMVDQDPQGHLATCFGINAESLKYTIANMMYACMDGFPIGDETILHNISNNLDLLPSNKKLTTVADRLVFQKSREQEEDAIPSEEVLKSVLAKPCANSRSFSAGYQRT